MTVSRAQRAGATGLCLIAVLTMLAPWIAPHAPSDQFGDRALAPPMRVHIRDASGFHAPFVYRQVLVDRLERRFAEDRASRVPLRWLAGGRLVSIDPANGPLLFLGGDTLGRDLWSRLLFGARLSLGVTALGALMALAVGAAVGGVAGTLGGRTSSVLMLGADFLLVLPGVYLVLVLRAALPQTLSTAEVFVLMILLFAIAGWPHVARGVRAIVATERASDYAEAARAAGAGPLRIARQLVPAARGFLVVEMALLVPALLAAEATISFLGLGFPEPAPSWGTLLREASSLNAMTRAPWTLAPAVALFLVVLCVQLSGGRTVSANFLLGARTTAKPRVEPAPH